MKRWHTVIHARTQHTRTHHRHARPLTQQTHTHTHSTDTHNRSHDTNTHTHTNKLQTNRQARAVMRRSSVATWRGLSTAPWIWRTNGVTSSLVLSTLCLPWLTTLVLGQRCSRMRAWPTRSWRRCVRVLGVFVCFFYDERKACSCVSVCARSLIPVPGCSQSTGRWCFVSRRPAVWKVLEKYAPISAWRVRQIAEG